MTGLDIAAIEKLSPSDMDRIREQGKAYNPYLFLLLGAPMKDGYNRRKELEQFGLTKVQRAVCSSMGVEPAEFLQTRFLEETSVLEEPTEKDTQIAICTALGIDLDDFQRMLTGP